MAIQLPRSTRHLNKTLGPGPIWLSAYRGGSSPSWSPNFIRAIRRFAGYRGLALIPQKTVEKLNGDRYFKYCFSGLVAYSCPYKRPTFIMRDAQELFARWERLLNHPGETGDHDIEFGLSLYMNNFPSFMPGGSVRRYYLVEIAKMRGSKEHLVKINRELAAIDEVLKRLELTEDAIRLGKRYEKEYRAMPLTEKAEYMKICIQVFEILMDQYKFSWKELKA
jgi:hypothetical protein